MQMSPKVVVIVFGVSLMFPICVVMYASKVDMSHCKRSVVGL